MSASDAVLSALQTLYTNPDPRAKEEANVWLQSFQKEPEAWQTANEILSSPDAAVEPKLFAAQTFRSKIIYDLDQLTQDHRIPLRDSLLSALKTLSQGPRVVITQLCLALADLLLQMPEWTNALPAMMSDFGSNPLYVPALLEFITVLPQEVTGNARIELINQDYMSAGADHQIMACIAMYFSASGVTQAIRKQSLTCLSSWLRAGEIAPSLVVSTPLFSFAFDSLASDDLFDEAADLICDLIHETQELQDNIAVIQEIVPRLVQLKPLLEANKDDSEKLRGFCRIFVEAGERYISLIVQHPDQFITIVEAIAMCADCEELEIVCITLNFWWSLAKALRKLDTSSNPSFQPIINIVANLVDTVIRHLHYPYDSDFTAEERDEFKNFRHIIGDALKDCCTMLGPQRCLKRSYDIIAAEVAKGSAARWQAIEAPLFSMRSMGAEADLQDDQVMPLIMAIIPKLPPHPKIRYAATLVVSRYSLWIAHHPDQIQAHLSYISEGFSLSSTEADVPAASAQALRYLCLDCNQHLIPYLPQLHQFLQQYEDKLQREDALEISIGLAHVIDSMPPNDAIQALQLFCTPILEQVMAFANRTDEPSKVEVYKIMDALERLTEFVRINARLSERLPASCSQTAQQAWSVIDTLLQRFGHRDILAERACSTIRRGLELFQNLVAPCIPAMLERMTTSFETTGLSSYLWITTRLCYTVSRAQDQQLHQLLFTAFQKQTVKLASLMQAQNPTEIHYAIDDYVALVIAIIEFFPNEFIQTPVLDTAISIAIAGSNLHDPRMVYEAVDCIRRLVGHDVFLEEAPASIQPLAARLRASLQQVGPNLTDVLLRSIVVSSLEECAPTGVVLARLMATLFPQEFGQWVHNAFSHISPKTVSSVDRNRFLTDFNTAMQAGDLNKVRSAFSVLDRASRKSRERDTMKVT